MRALQVPPALAERLGERATDGFVAALGTAGHQWKDEMLTVAADRYERRLTEEISRLRVEFAREMGGLRSDVTAQIGRLRADTSDQIGELRGEMGTFRAVVTQELAAARVDQFKWSFAFWIGQVATTAGLLAYMLRATP